MQTRSATCCSPTDTLPPQTTSSAVSSNDIRPSCTRHYCVCVCVCVCVPRKLSLCVCECSKRQLSSVASLT
jgi:hypothetical protein